VVKVLRWGIIIAWLACIPVGVIYAPKLFNILKDDLNSQAGSPSAIAMQYFENDDFCFPDSAVVMVSVRAGWAMPRRLAAADHVAAATAHEALPWVCQHCGGPMGG